MYIQIIITLSKFRENIDTYNYFNFNFYCRGKNKGLSNFAQAPYLLIIRIGIQYQAITYFFFSTTFSIVLLFCLSFHEAQKGVAKKIDE